ncbi:MAG: GTPase ObgE [Acidimicrobiia bacterium]|nr:GTPase ObgE [Acidimicrobiia bacterium]
MFVDEAQICVSGGAGGAGCVSFLREAMRPRGGPDGGDGGKGGDVILVADPSVGTLIGFTRRIHWTAGAGRHGSGKNKHGRAGADLRILVPPGTTARTLEGDLVCDLVRPGDAAVVVEGGRGGRGNARFKTESRRIPTFAEQGEAGVEAWLRLELKLLADVALVGWPNAGKSTLISRISAARPKIADYPFTTLTPNLGVVTVDDTDFVVADVPGLIEGAAEGKGLGHRFLRHVERSRVLAVLLDPHNPEVDVVRQHTVLLEELEKYRPGLLDRPRVVAVTKADVIGDAWELPAGAPVEVVTAHRISAVAGEGLDSFVRELGAAVAATRTAAVASAGLVVHRPAPGGITVRRDGGAWVVVGADAVRAVALSDLTDPQALAYVQNRLRGLGVFEMLEEAGCEEGGIVQIGDFEFEYAPESQGATSARSDAHTRRARPESAAVRHRLAGAGRKRGQRRGTRQRRKR